MFLIVIGLDEAIGSLRNQGIQVLVYINPNLNIQGELFKTGDSKGYMLKNNRNVTIMADFGEFRCGTVDLTNPKAFNWYKGIKIF